MTYYIISSNIQRHHYSGDLKKLMNDLLLAPTEGGVNMILDRILEIGGTDLQGKLNSYCIIFLLLLITFVYIGWVDFYSNRWVKASLNYACSRIPEIYWISSDDTSNIAKACHSDAN